MIKKKYKELKNHYSKWVIFLILFQSIARRIINNLATLYWRVAGVRMGKGTTIQYGVKINCPKKITLGKNCLITKGASITSENHDSGILLLEDNVQINKKSHLDITGELTIKRGSLISEGTFIYTHDHGYDPRSTPITSSLNIGEKVWIGANSTILSSVSNIDCNSIIGTNTLVTKDIDKNSLVVGVPGKVIKILN